MTEPKTTADLNIPHSAEERAKMTGYDRKDPNSYGKRMVGFAFNPSGNPKVAQIKGLYAEIIDICDAGKANAKDNDEANFWHEAILRALDAQMWAVKGATWQLK